MDIDKAREIIAALADGVDPLTGESFSAESPYQQAEIVRALYVAKEVLVAAARREQRQRTLPANAGKPWNEEESQQLIAGFEQKMSINNLAKKHQRTHGAIESQLVKLGKLDDSRKIYFE